MLGSVDLSDYMIRDPVKVSPGDNVFVVIDTIIDNKISGVCVVDENGMLVGVLSELDCLKAILGAVYNEGNVGTVADYMTSEVDSCESHADVVDVASDMLEKGHRRRPVVENGKLVGQITCRKILRAVSHFNDDR